MNHHRRSAAVRALRLPSALAIVVLASIAPAAGGPTRAVASGPPTGCAAPPTSLGLDAYRHWDKLSYLEMGPRVLGQSTADPGGSNLDTFHVMRSLPSGGRVLLDELGPGVVSFMRMQESSGGPWDLSVDNRAPVRVAAADLGTAAASSFPALAMPYPLSMNANQTMGSSILATAIPFNGRVTWSSTAPNGNFYALLRKLPYGTPLQSWTGAEQTSDVVAQLRAAGTDVAPTGIPGLSGTLSLTPGTATTVASLGGGPSQLRALQFRAPFAQKVALGNSRLQIYWDGEATPSVDAPLKFLVGDGAGVYQPATRPLVQGYPASAGGDGSTYMDFDLYWPMPFHSSARIVLSPPGGASVSGVQWSLRYQSFPDPAPWWGTFHATYTAIPTPVPGKDMTFLDVAGSGRVVGTVVNFNRVGGTLEGDPRIYIDDSRTPQVAVTGTEEWGTGGDYWRGGIQTSLPMGGLPSSNDNPPGQDVDGAALYRFLIPDSVPFDRHLTMRWEHGGTDDVTEPYKATVLWYGTPTQAGRLTDDLVLGDPSSRSAHQYTSPNEQDYTLTSAYGYPVNSPLVTMGAVATSTASSFRMALDPANAGAFLRRTLDYGVPDQRADVYVDGLFAGTWYSGGSSAVTGVDGNLRRWRDEEFPLPPAMTAGKASIGVQLRFAPTSSPANVAFTEAEYKLYSLVVPGCASVGEVAPPVPAPPAPPTGLVATMDAFGAVSPGQPGAPSAPASWPGWRIARDVAIDPSGHGGYVLDGFGGVHPVGNAVPVGLTAYWRGWDIARAIAVRADGVSGYTLDAFGGIHPFGGTPPVVVTGYWGGWDIARDIVLRPDGMSGYVLDGFGGLHPFGPPGDIPPPLASSGYWPGWDIAHRLTLDLTGTGGYVLDGYGGLHPFGSTVAAPAPRTTGYWPRWDIARDIELAPGAPTSGYVLDGYGGVHPFGGAPPPSSAYTPGADIWRGVGG